MEYIKKCSAFGRDDSNGGCCNNHAGLCASNCEHTIMEEINEDTPAWMLEFPECIND